MTNKDIKIDTTSTVSIGIDYNRLIHVDIVEDNFIDYIQESVLEIQVWSEQNIDDFDEDESLSPDAIKNKNKQALTN